MHIANNPVLYNNKKIVNRVDDMLCVFTTKCLYIFFKGIILSTLNVPISLLVQIIIRVRELILLITPFNHAGEIIELSKEANKLSVKSNWSISLCHRIVGGS